MAGVTYSGAAQTGAVQRGAYNVEAALVVTFQVGATQAGTGRADIYWDAFVIRLFLLSSYYIFLERYDLEDLLTDLEYS